MITHMFVQKHTGKTYNSVSSFATVPVENMTNKFQKGNWAQFIKAASCAVKFAGSSLYGQRSEKRAILGERPCTKAWSFDE